MGILQIIKQILCSHNWKGTRSEYSRYDRLTNTDITYLQFTWVCTICDSDGGKTGCILKCVCHKCGGLVWDGYGRPQQDFCNVCYPLMTRYTQKT